MQTSCILHVANKAMIQCVQHSHFSAL